MSTLPRKKGLQVLGDIRIVTNNITINFFFKATTFIGRLVGDIPPTWQLYGDLPTCSLYWDAYKDKAVEKYS